jgi:lysophospholipase L1-like esterase
MVKLILLYPTLFFLLCSVTRQNNTRQSAESTKPIEKSFAYSEADSIAWFDPRNGPFNLVGFEWISQEKTYRRLPENPQWPIRKAVDHLADNTAGGQIRFITNSNLIMIKTKLRQKSGMYHMPATGQSGFDLYVKVDNTFIYQKTSRFQVDTLEYTSSLYESTENKMREFIINFPLYNGVEKVEIGFEKEAIVKHPTPFSIPGKIVIYGTSITQGGCVSRPGMAYSNILSRELNSQFVNLGFSGNGEGESELAKIIAQINNVSLFILDYEANVGKDLKNTLEPFIQILRSKYPEIPILLMSKIRYANQLDGSKEYDQLIANKIFQEKLVEKLKSKGDNNIFFMDGSKVLGSDFYECTVDGIHPNDLGARRIADGLKDAIYNILEINK